MIKNTGGILESFILSMLAHVQSCVHEGDIIRVVLYPQNNRNEDKLFDGGDKIILILSKMPHM